MCSIGDPPALEHCDPSDSEMSNSRVGQRRTRWMMHFASSLHDKQACLNEPGTSTWTSVVAGNTDLVSAADMRWMFCNASNFNGGLLSSVIHMKGMFLKASKFNQDIST
eukprot:g77705.t1